MKNISIFATLIFFFLIDSITSTNPFLELNTAEEKTLEDNTYSFYTLEIPSSTQNESLIISIKGIDAPGIKFENMSDPDIYVSKHFTNPKNEASSTWSGNRYGGDIVTIGSSHVKKGDLFYIGVFCEFRCNYKLEAYLTETIDVIEGRVHIYKVPKETSILLQFQSKSSFKELSMAFLSYQLTPFAVFVHNTNPSSSNTFALKSSWISGYSLNIYEGSKEYFPNHKYQILLQAKEINAEIRLLISYPETEIKLKSTEPIFGSVNNEKSRCYNFTMQSFNNDESVIINMLLFSGSVILHLGGFKSITDLTFDKIPYNEYTYKISSEQVIIITPDTIKEMKKSKNENDNNLHFCIFGKGSSSYFLNIHFDYQVELMQNFNMIQAGTSISGYLPKKKVTTYNLLSFSQESNISFSLISLQGKPLLYAYFSDAIPSQYITETILQKELKENHILSSQETSFGYNLQILNENNNCHKLKRDTGDLNDQINQISCSLYAIVYCSGDDESCIYLLTATQEKRFRGLIPKTTFYNILPKDQVDVFRIIIDDSNLQTIAFVLQTLSGDTTLYVNYIKPGATQPLSFTSYTQFNLPLTVTLSPSKVNNDNLNGTYEITVKGVAFSTYSIYYYTHSKIESQTKPDWSSVSKKILSSDIAHESLKELPYQIFSYEHNENDSKEIKDIIITLTRRNIRCVFYVFLDLTTLEYKTIDQLQSFEGYDWRSDYDDELIISKTDPKYKSKGTYYIIVARASNNISNKTNDAIETFGLSVINEGDDLNLYYDHHSLTLKNDYKGQGYLFWNLMMNPLSLSINVQSGRINLYIDFKRITPKRIKEEKNTFFQIEEDIGSHHLTIPAEIFKSKCTNKFTDCSLSIYIERQSEQEVNYLIIASGEENKIQLLPPEVILPNTLASKVKHYYIVSEFDISSTKSLLVSFSEGNGQVYVLQVSYSNQEIKIDSFPNEIYHQFKGENTYYGQLITIPPNDQSHCLYCQYLITVAGEAIDYKTGLISYTIQYSKEIKVIYPNKPTNGLIKEGQIEYYQFNFGPEAKSVYVSLYNRKGDIDLFLNYGVTKPEFNKHHWRSIDPSYSFIEIDSSDPVLIEQGAKTLEGVYTILIRGYSTTTYTLFVTSHQKKIVPIDNNSPGSCKCKEKNDTCHFRFDRLIQKNEPIDNNVTIVFTTNFIYGSGIMYAKIYNRNIYEITEQLPSETNADYSNNNHVNFMKIEISKSDNNLSSKSLLIITVQCHEKSLFDINASKLSKYGQNYLDISRQNMLYLKKHDAADDKAIKKNLLTFFNFEQKDLNYEMYSYTGTANVLVYQNITRYNDKIKAYDTEYVHLSQFIIEPRTSYYNTVRANSKNTNSNIHFDIKPSTDFGFYIKLNYDQEWTKVNIGRIDSFVVSHNEFHGYFDFHEDYQDVVLNVRCDNPKSYASVYTKRNIISKMDDMIGSDMKQKYVIPTTSVYDHKGKTNPIISSVSLKISKEQSQQDKLVRVLFVVVIDNKEHSKYDSNVISVLITPKVNFYQRISTKPLGLYYSTESIVKNDTTIFDLSKQRSADDILVIDISTCEGDIDYKLTNQLTYFAMASTTQGIKADEVKENGRSVITLAEAKEDNYFLSVWATKAPECDKSSSSSKEDNDSTCNKDIEYLMHYFTTSKDEFNINIVNPIFSINQNDKGIITLLLEPIKNKDLSGKIRDPTDLDFQVFVSTDVHDFNHMESLCYLSKINPYLDMYYDSSDNKIHIASLKKNTRYYINVKMKDLKTGEMFAFKPMQLTIENKIISLIYTWVFIIVIIGLALAIGLLYYFYRKYKATKLLLQYEMTDQRNLAQIPKSTSEVKSYNDTVNREKYFPISKELESL